MPQPTQAASPELTPHALLDEAVIADLQFVLGASLRATALEATDFLVAAVAECEAASTSGDLMGLARIAHRLKGGAGMIGAAGIVRAAADLESAALLRWPEPSVAELEIADRLRALRAATEITVDVLRSRFGPPA